MVWVRSEGEERCQFAESWVWERIGFAGEVCLVCKEWCLFSGGLGAGEVGFCSREEMV